MTRSLGIGVAGLLVWLCSFAAQAQVEHELKLDVSGLMDAGSLFSLTPETLEKKFAAAGFRENPFVRWQDDGRTAAAIQRRPFSNVLVDLTALEGRLPLSEARVWFENGKAVRASWVATRERSRGDADGMRLALTTALGADPVATDKRISGFKNELGLQAVHWNTTVGMASLETGPGFLAAHLGVPGRELPPLSVESRPPPRGDAGSDTLEFFVRLDALMKPSVLWTLTPDHLHKLVPDPGGLSKSPHFAWTTEARDGARFARQLFSNTVQDVLLFDDGVKAEEALLDFKDGRAIRLNISILNRGDSGEINPELFQSCYKAAGRALGSMLGVTPRAHRIQGKGVGQTEGWIWSTPQTVATLEYNAEALKGKVEFLRLRLAPASDRTALMNVAAIGGARSKSALMQNIKRDTATGEVVLSGVPMVDQGQKGYCVAATCQRVFNYMGISCDQHEMAGLLETSAQKGTDLAVMYEALSKVDSKYGTRFKAVKANQPFMRMTYKELERYQKPDMLKIVKQYIDEGQPLLWAVNLGRAPRLPNLPQQDGGHMRLIIGYNSKSNDVIFSDSWGAGHEKKSMMASAADVCTDAVFVMEPQR